jgi:hypothetical protein
MENSGARDTLIHEKKLKVEISCQTPFKPICYVSTINVRRSVPQIAIPQIYGLNFFLKICGHTTRLAICGFAICGPYIFAICGFAICGPNYFVWT